MPLVSQAEYAAHRGISRQAVHKAVKAGRIQLVDGKVDVEAADRAWNANTDQSAPSNSVTGNPAGAAARRAGAVPPPTLPAGSGSGGGAAPQGPTYATSRAVREAYMARLARLEYEEKAGELVRADEVRVQVFNAIRKARDLLLAMPDRVAPQVAPSQSEIHTVHTVLTGEVERVLEELRSGFSGGRGVAGVGGGLGGATTADR